MCDDAARPTEAAIRLGEAVASEAERLGKTQGQLIEHMWDFYQKANQAE